MKNTFVALILSAAFPYIFFAWLSIHFYALLLRCVRSFWAAFHFFPASLFIIFFLHVCIMILFLGWFAQYWLCKILLLCMGESDYSAHEQDLPPCVKCATPTNKILSQIRTFSLGPFRSNVPFGKSVLRSSLRAAGCFSPSATSRFFVKFRNIKAPHVLLCLCLPSHLTCLLYTRI